MIILLLWRVYARKEKFFCLEFIRKYTTKFGNIFVIAGMISRKRAKIKFGLILLLLLVL